MHSDDLGGGLKLSLRGLDELALEGGVVLDVSGLVDAAVDGTSGGLIRNLSVGLSIDVFALNSREVTTVA